MSDQSLFERRDKRLREMASAFSYPPTPDIAGAARQRLAKERPVMASQRTRRDRRPKLT